MIEPAFIVSAIQGQRAMASIARLATEGARPRGGLAIGFALLVRATRASDTLPDEISVDDHEQGDNVESESQHGRQHNKQ